MNKLTRQLIFGALETLPEQEGTSAPEAPCFVPLDPLACEPPSACALCQSNLGLIRYELLVNDAVVRGICCVGCFPRLLRMVKRYGSEEFAAQGPRDESHHLISVSAPPARNSCTSHGSGCTWKPETTYD
jgi:hypothetical protein